jgi:hypothetical protein
MGVDNLGAVVVPAFKDTDYIRGFNGYDTPGTYEYRVRIDYDGGVWYTATGTATITLITLEGVPNVEVTSGPASGVVGGLLAASVADSHAPASVVGSASATAETSSHAAEGTIG